MCDTRHCNYCGLDKPLTEFEKGRGGKYTTRCKACHAKYQRAKRSGTDLAMRLQNRINTLKQFAEQHNIEVYIEVRNDESEWD